MSDPSARLTLEIQRGSMSLYLRADLGPAELALLFKAAREHLPSLPPTPAVASADQIITLLASLREDQIAAIVSVLDPDQAEQLVSGVLARAGLAAIVPTEPPEPPPPPPPP